MTGWEEFAMAVSDPSHPCHLEFREWGVFSGLSSSPHVYHCS